MRIGSASLIGPGVSALDLVRAREAVAQEYGFALYRSYDEKTAAGLIGADYSTLKRWRRARQVPFVRRGSGVRYMGFQIADLLLRGTQPAEVLTPEASDGCLSAGSNSPAANKAAHDCSNVASQSMVSDVSGLARSIVLRRTRS